MNDLKGRILQRGFKTIIGSEQHVNPTSLWKILWKIFWKNPPSGRVSTDYFWWYDKL